jgi:hypothetical protein
MKAVTKTIRRGRRDAKIAVEVAALEKAIAGAPVGGPSEAEMRQIYAAARKGRKR